MNLQIKARIFKIKGATISPLPPPNPQLTEGAVNPSTRLLQRGGFLMLVRSNSKDATPSMPTLDNQKLFGNTIPV
jgi:hypothetical protein